MLRNLFAFFFENMFETFCCIFLKHNVYYHLNLFKDPILFLVDIRYTLLQIKV